ncbi:MULTISPECIES: MFS transporter [Prauserella salsuginis group]|uniref:Benzoate transport n=2 Tax=Prauserella salsuginis group TaxID=2893672 RepID=A0A839XU95_9PSEU|nr:MULTISPECIES: MFS transporter [Prauserella salsuginis group]MBB3664608.1 benzoate transport [Prauserella sediminis]MCR3722057.1 benzoate transport [Prauserella flava]MCR3736054.1 benzoate transport [Prauserella salsuginis]
MNITERIGAAPMSGYQWLIVALCTFMNCLDGFDVMAVAFTGPSVTDEFGLSGSEFGLLVSVGLIGMALGSMLLAPFADLIGRRPLILISLALGTIGMFGAAMAPSMPVMGVFRLVTGIGVGGILASSNVMTSEFSNTKNRGLAIGIFTAGYGIGATVASVVAKAAVGGDWRIVFYAGGFATLLALVVIALLLPESVAYLEQRRPQGALERINRTLARMKMGSVSWAELDEAASARETAGRTGSGWLKQLLTPTILLWAVFITIMFGFYFVNSWTPTLLVEDGLSESAAVTAGMAISIGGTVGSVLYGVAARIRTPRVVLIGFSLLAAAMMVVFILSTSVLWLGFGIGVLVGALINGCIAGAYTVGPPLYPAHLRSVGMGWALGMGRIGAILSPTVAGMLNDAGASATQLYVGAAAVVAICAIVLVGLRRHDPESAPAMKERDAV